MDKEKGILGEISFDDLLGDLQDSQEKAIMSGVSIDIAIKLAMFAAAKVIEPEYLLALFEAMEDPILEQFSGEDNIKIAKKHFDDMQKAVMDLNKEFREA